MKQIGAVIIASGYGRCRMLDGIPYPKVAELVARKPMVVHVVDIVGEAGLAPQIVVVNPLFGADIQAVLKEYGKTELQYAVQPKRSGAADAVLQAMPLLREGGVEHFLVIYADMPLWRPTTVRKIAALHEREKPTVTMISVALEGDYPRELERYGRVIRNSDGDIVRIVEPADAIPEELASRAVNPSLWVWEREWFLAHTREIPLTQRKDGYEPERYLPPLVGIARRKRRRIIEVRIADPWEALGVNTPEELEHVRAVFRRRMSHNSELASVD